MFRYTSFLAASIFWFLGSTSSVVGAVIASAGFNDETGLNSNATSNSPYTIDSSIIGAGVGEPGWAGPWVDGSPLSVVQDIVAFEGDGSLQFDPISAPRRTLQAAQAGLFVVKQRVRFDDGARMVAYTEVNATDDFTGNQGAVWAAFPDGSVLVIDGIEDGCLTCSTEVTGFTWDPGVWYMVETRIDVPNRSWEFFFNGQKYQSADPLGFRGSPTQLDRLRFLSEGTGSVFLDELRVVPEANSIGLTIAGLFISATLLWSRQKRSMRDGLR